jgi:autotransporter translocation and assembly factor TamB
MNLSGIGDFDLKIQGKTPPKVIGRIILKQFAYEEPFGSPVTLALAGQKAADPSALWDWELEIEVPNNVWIRNSDMNAEFSGTVDLYRIEGQMIPLGILESFPGGKFYVAGKSFDIEQGRIIFENVEGIDPTLDFVISSRIYEAPEATGFAAGSGEQVQLTVTGTISQPVLGTPEGSEYTQQEVLEMMVLQSPGGSENGKSSPFQEKVLTSLGADVSSQLVQKFAYGLGVETFYLRPRRGTSGFDLSESELTVGGYLTRGLYWQYTSKFSANPDLSLQYRLNRNLFLEGTRDRSNLYHLGLNLRWEF